jgi:hypothetical protein
MIRTAQGYLSGLKDGRELYYRGEKSGLLAQQLRAIGLEACYGGVLPVAWFLKPADHPRPSRQLVGRVRISNFVGHSVINIWSG